MAISIVMYAILTFVTINYTYYTALASTNKVITIYDMNVREDIQDIQSILYLSADALEKDSVWFNCAGTEVECSDQDEEGYYPIYLSGVSTYSNNITLNGRKLSILFKRDGSTDIYLAKVKKKDKTYYRSFKRSVVGYISFSLTETGERNEAFPNSEGELFP